MESVGSDARKEIAKSDFLEALGKIDFEKAYDPFSKDYQTALNLGLMALVLVSLAGISGSEGSPETESIESVLADSKKSLQRYIETGDMSFKKASDDWLDRAEAMIRKAYSRLPSGDGKARLKALENEVGQIRKQG